MTNDLWLKSSFIYTALCIPKRTFFNRVKKASGWQKRPAKGLGGGYEFLLSSLPREIARRIETSIFIFEECFKSIEVKTQSQEDKILSFNAYVGVLCKSTQKSRTKIIKEMQSFAKNSAFSAELMDFLLSLNFKKANNSFGFLFNKELKENFKKNATEEKKKHIDKALKILAAFLPFYQKRQNPSISKAYREYQRHQESLALPVLTEKQIRYHLAKLPLFIREKNRRTGSEMKALRTFVRRDWSVLEANSCWVGDGHLLKCKIRNPKNGNPVRPEITLIMDTYSRLVVGYSLSYAENAMGVAEALYRGFCSYGLPAMYYSDNGPGQSNKLLDSYQGVFSSLDIKHTTSIPGNPEARGNIERLMRSLAKEIAEEMPTYFNKDTDHDTTRKMLYSLNSATKAEKGNRQLTKLQEQALTILPTHFDLIDAIERKVEEYNSKPHSSLDGKTPKELYFNSIEQVKEKGFYFEATVEELTAALNVSEIRKVNRAWLTVQKANYWHEDLMLFNGQEVICSISLFNQEQIKVYDLNNKFICTAQRDGNTTPAFNPAMVDNLSKKRKTKREQLTEKMAALEKAAKQIQQQKEELLSLFSTESIREAVNDEVLHSQTEQQISLLNKLLNTSE